jgi:hypothetical protein
MGSHPCSQHRFRRTRCLRTARTLLLARASPKGHKTRIPSQSVSDNRWFGPRNFWIREAPGAHRRGLIDPRLMVYGRGGSLLAALGLLGSLDLLLSLKVILVRLSFFATHCRYQDAAGNNTPTWSLHNFLRPPLIWHISHKFSIELRGSRSRCMGPISQERAVGRCLLFQRTHLKSQAAKRFNARSGDRKFSRQCSH